jgi:hypothetical protein
MARRPRGTSEQRPPAARIPTVTSDVPLPVAAGGHACVRRRLPSVSRLHTVASVEDSRPFDELRAAYPEAIFCRVDGVLYAWIPAGWDRAVGTTAHGDTEDELLAKLDGP